MSTLGLSTHWECDLTKCSLLPTHNSAQVEVVSTLDGPSQEDALSAGKFQLRLHAIYHRPGFNCESLINANCDFSLKAQLLEHNYYYAMINSVHVTHMLTLLCSCDQKWASYATWSLLPVTPSNSWRSRPVGQHHQGGEPVGGKSNYR